MLTSKGDYLVHVADIPVVLGGIDPCMCCMDRSVKFIDPAKGKEWSLSWEQLKLYVRKKWEKEGVKAKCR